MYTPRELRVKDFLKDRTVIPVYKKPKAARCEQLEHFCRTTTNHGFAHVVDNDEYFYLRIVWGLVVVALVFCLVACVHGNVVNLISGRLYTEFVEQDGNEDGSGMVLPDIHVCDPSIFSQPRLTEMGFNNTMAAYLTLATSPNAEQEYLIKNPKRLKQLKADFEQILHNQSLTMSDIIAKAALKLILLYTVFKNNSLNRFRNGTIDSCTEIVSHCTQKGETYYSKKCCETFFSKATYVSIFGACISTHGNPIKQLYASRDAGFVVYTKPNLKNNINFFEEGLIKEEYVLQKGMYYAVSSPTVHIETVLHTEGRFTTPDTWVSVPITKIVIDNTELKDSVLSPYTCVFTNDSDFRKQKSPEYDFYSVRNCESAFTQQEYRKRVNCSAVFFNYGNTTQLCHPQAILGINATEKIPKDWCPVECDKEIFQVSPSYSAFYEESITKSYEKIHNITNITLPDYVVLHFFYPTFKHQMTVIHVNTWLKFLGEVGGNLGLFLGASLISITEIVVLVFRCFFKSTR